MQSDKKEKWIAETLDSLQGIQRAELSAAMQAKIVQRLQKRSAKIVSLPPRQAWQAAACILVLVAANAFACFRFVHSSGSQQANEGRSVAQEYFAFTNLPEL